LLFAALPSLAQTLFVMPGAGGAVNNVLTYSASNLTPGVSVAVSSSAFRAISTLNGSKIYILTASSANSLYSLTNDLGTASPVANFGYPTTGAVLSLDGQTLYVAAGSLHALATASDTEITLGPVNGAVLDLDASIDGAQIFLLTQSGTSFSLSALSTVTNNVTNTITLPANASSLAVGPNGLVYVTMPNAVYEVDPNTYAVLNKYAVSGLPGKPVFTPDGHYLIAANQQAGGTAAVTVVDLFAHSVFGAIAPSALPAGAVLDSLYIGSNNLVIGYSKNARALFDISLNSLTLAPAPYVPSGTQVLAAAVTPDVAVGRHLATSGLFYLTSSGVTQVSLGSLTQIGSVSFNVPEGALSVVQPEAFGQGTNFILYGNNQTIPVGGISQPLVVRVFDANGNPQASVNVAFTSSNPSSLLLTSSNLNTNALGYASTTVKAINGAGPMTINVSIGGAAPVQMTINVTGGAGAGSGGTSGAGSLEVVAGQGQLIEAYHLVSLSSIGNRPFEVLVKDGNGNPVPNQPVVFTLVQGIGNLIPYNGVGSSTGPNSITVPSDSNGVASVDMIAGQPLYATPGFDQELITATSGGLSVNIYCTTVSTAPGASGLSIYRLLPAYGTEFSGPAGSTIPGAVKFQIVSNSGEPLPNIGLSLDPPSGVNPNTTPGASCAGTPLSDNNGIVICNAVLNGVIGSSTVTPDVGYFQTSLPIPVNITPGPPALFTKLQGDGQSGKPGQALPISLVAQLTDAFGNPLAAQPVTFAVTSGSATLSGAPKVTDPDGKAQVVVILGKVPGPVTIAFTAGSGSNAVVATFEETVVVVPGGLVVVSGNNQSALTGAQFSQPLVVQALDNQKNPVPGVTVNFSVTSGAATLGAPSATTDNNGNANVTVTAGATAGSIVVTAAYANFTATFNLTVTPPGPSNVAFLNGASFVQNGPAPGSVTPGEILTITGTNLTPGVNGVVTPPAGPLPTSLDGIQVLFGGNPAPIFAVINSNGVEQINLLVPFGISSGASTSVTITNANGSATLLNVPIAQYAPGIFTTPVNGTNYAVAVDGTTGAYITPSSPAVPGHPVVLFAEGMGQTIPVVSTNVPGAGQAVSAPVTVTLNGVSITSGVTAVYQPQVFGVYLVTFELPASLNAGSYPLTITITPPGGTPAASQTVQLPVGAAPAQ
jgi:uncharacterized protein (TIGR03437 family)